jgi:hypothetical protein
MGSPKVLGRGIRTLSLRAIGIRTFAHTQMPPIA